jgi:hypothetical protein
LLSGFIVEIKEITEDVSAYDRKLKEIRELINTRMSTNAH